MVNILWLFNIQSLLAIINPKLLFTINKLSNENQEIISGIFVYVVVCIFNIVIGGLLILCFCFEILQLIKNKKQNKNNVNNENISTNEIKAKQK